jgi:TPR repeat protein
MKGLWLLCLLTLLLGCATNPQKEDPMEIARESFKSGNYHESATLLMPLAQKGDAEAQYALGYQFFYGLGVKRDKTQGFFWMQQSAIQGYKPAREALLRLTDDTKSRI